MTDKHYLKSYVSLFDQLNQYWEKKLKDKKNHISSP